jgi:hypothetical protein
MLLQNSLIWWWRQSQSPNYMFQITQWTKSNWIVAAAAKTTKTMITRNNKNNNDNSSIIYCMTVVHSIIQFLIWWYYVLISSNKQLNCLSLSSCSCTITSSTSSSNSIPVINFRTKIKVLVADGLLDHLISQPSLDIPPIQTPLITEVKKLQLRQV